jgi:hypothetical protein
MIAIQPRLLYLGMHRDYKSRLHPTLFLKLCSFTPEVADAASMGDTRR